MIRWIKGDGKDDAVTRSAIAQATRLFGADVDYCLCSAGISAGRARDVLAWAVQPVELRPVGPEDNPRLAEVLRRAGCKAERFGYWWKWFPERVRPNAPEWILDGDMVITGAPPWFGAWREGRDRLRVTQDDAWDINGLYGEYLPFVDAKLRLYSGLISLPPRLRYLPAVLRVLRRRPLAPGHDGCENMSEQGVIAAAMGRLRATPIPLHEFPFGRAFEDRLNFGLAGPQGTPWGYHFGFAFRRDNPHFERLAAAGTIFFADEEPPPQQRYIWMRNVGQWGRPGWSMNMDCVDRIAALAAPLRGRRVLEIGTSRGYLAAVMAALGCRVTTVDAADRGARSNLEGLGVAVQVESAANFLERCGDSFALITVDLHGNGVDVWQELWPLLGPRLERNGALVLYNSHLWKIPEWKSETGLKWVMETQLVDWSYEAFADPLPGMIVCRHG
ncbi:MAG: hypothetical protein AB7G15_01715 [Alphaproteobacteria bacterium]